MARKSRALTVASVGVCSVMLMVVHAQQNATKTPARAMTLTAMDYMEIQQLAVRYSYALDSGADRGEMFANLFAPDGAFLSATRGRIEGHDPLVALGRGRGGPNPPRRFIVNHVVTPTPLGATGQAYVVEVELPPDGQIGGKLTSTGGRYEDEYEKTPAGWRFKTREFIPSKVGSEAAAAPTSPAVPTQPGTARPDATTRQADTKGKPSTKAARTLTAADYIEIQQLVSRYGYAIDSGADNGTGSVYGGLFTADGEFHGPAGAPGGNPFNAKGTEALAALVRTPPNGGDRSTRVSHFLMNHLIEPSAEGATGKVYLLVINFGRDGKPSSLSMGGHYDDVYAQTPEGWRFKSRNFVRGAFESEPAATVPAVAKAEEKKTSSPVKASQLAPMDYIEIRKLVANYGYGLDTGADNGGMYADLFAPDGSIFGRSGRENILALARREPHGPHYARHFLTNVLIEPSPEGATGKQYLAVIDIGENGNPSSFFLGGRYEDTYVKTPQGWRFKSRNLVRANAPASQPAPAR